MSENSLAVNAAQLHSQLLKRSDFTAFAHDVSESVLFSLERRHLDHLDFQRMAFETSSRAALRPGDLRFLKVQQIGHSAEMDRSLDVLNMQNVLGALRDGSHSFIMALRAEPAQTRLYLGARQLRSPAQDSIVASDALQHLQRALEGNLPGTLCATYPNAAPAAMCPEEEVRAYIKDPLEAMGGYPFVAAITGIPSLREDRELQFAQSMDRMTHALQGQDYLMLVIAEPVPDAQTSQIINNCFRLSSEIHAWVKISTNFSQAVSEANARGKTVGHNEGGSVSDSVTKSLGISKSRQPGALVGGLLGAGVSLMLAPLAGPAGIAVAGLSMLPSMASMSLSGMVGGTGDSNTDGTSNSRSQTWGESLTESLTDTSTKSDTASINIERFNKTAEYCEKILDSYAQRIQRGKNLGMWNVGVYFLAKDPSTFAQGRAQLCSLYSGKDTHLEPMRSIDLSGAQSAVKSYLGQFTNPTLNLQDAQTGEPLNHPLGALHRSISTPLNTEELSILMNLPRREMPGLKLEMVADFGLNPRPVTSGSTIKLGHLVSGSSILPIEVGLAPDDLTRHIFVTGITGGGKTNTCFALLKSVAERGIPFFVLEPAKGEYRLLLGDDSIPNLHVYTPGDEMVSPFRVNPFQFIPGMNLITHLDNLKAIFNASFPMYAAMPYLLEESLVQAYEENGWDLVTSSNTRFNMREVVKNWQEGRPDYRYTHYLPRLSALIRIIDEVVDKKGYGEEVRKNYAAALKARVSSLLIGSKGRMLDTQAGIPYEELFGQNTILELRAMGDDDEKCFLMALLLTQLYQYRDFQHRWRPERGLRHLTVLEESHRLLGRASGGGGQESADPRGKAVETFANMLAEIREYGEGFLIIDQTPGKLIPDVVKNTSAKIMHRLSARDDRDVMGDAMSMNEMQREIPPRLRVGEAVFHTQDQDKPILVQIASLKSNREPVSDEQVRKRMQPIHDRRLKEWTAQLVGRTREESRKAGVLAEFIETKRQEKSPFE